MFFSIIIPCYNSEEYIERCISSIYENVTCEFSFEVIVINDGSKDKTLEVLNTILDKFNDLIVVNNENFGPSFSRNIGIEMAQGEYLLFLDSDDFYLKGTLLGLYKYILNYQMPDVLEFNFSYLKKYDEQSVEQKIDNPVWHLHKGNPKKNELPVTYTLLLNLASVCHANDSETIWGYVSTYSSGVKRSPELDLLIKLAVNYYKEKIEPFKSYRLPDEIEKKGIKELIKSLSVLNEENTSDEIQSLVFSIGKKLEYENLRDWFKGLYQTVLGQSEGPRMGSFIKLYGIKSTIQLLENVLEGKLVK